MNTKDLGGRELGEGSNLDELDRANGTNSSVPGENMEEKLTSTQGRRWS